MAGLGTNTGIIDIFGDHIESAADVIPENVSLTGQMPKWQWQ
jgi:hypothetical protein